MHGVNLAGAEFGRTRGVYGTDYIYPNAAELDYYHSKGIDLIRLPFTWERMQPTLGQNLSQAEFGRMLEFLDAAVDRGMKVVIDLHNYGRYDGHTIGSAAVPIAAFKDFWIRLADALKGNPAIWGLGLMNEPHDMGSASVWPSAAQAAVDGIRSTGNGQTIIVAGDNWAGAWSWKQANANLKVSDPLHRVVYEAHQYFDRGSDGVYGSYDQEQAYPTVGVDRVQPFLDWLHENNLRGFIGEYGVPDNDPRWLAVLDNFLRVLAANDIPSAYWAGGSWWGNYSLAIEPRSGSDRPQMDILERYVHDDDFSFTASVASHADFNGDGADDLLWRDHAGTVAIWLLHGKMISSAALQTVTKDWRIEGTGDFNADNRSDILWQNENGSVAIWKMNGTALIAGFVVGTAPKEWKIQLTGDFNGDGNDDILWRNQSTGQMGTWELKNGAVVRMPWLLAVPEDWQVAGTGDFNGDGTSDILWRNTVTGGVATWELNRGAVTSTRDFGSVSHDWHIVGTGDFNGDSKSDILWRNDSGTVVTWEMNGQSRSAVHTIGGAGLEWRIETTGDFNNDGRSDVMWRNHNGTLASWELNGAHIIAIQAFPTVGNEWQLF
jgi:endoglucanase